MYSADREAQSAGVAPTERRRRAGRKERVCEADKTGLGVPPRSCCRAGSPSFWKGWMGPPRRRTTLEGLGARPATDVLPGIGLALGGWVSRALQRERPGSASAKQHIERREEKSSTVKTQQLGNPVKTYGRTSRKSQEVGSSYDCAQDRTIGEA